MFKHLSFVEMGRIKAEFRYLQFIKSYWFKIYFLAMVNIKELSFCHKLRFSNSNNLATRFPFIFQTINSGRSNSLSLKYQRLTPSGCKDIGVRKFKFVAKTQFL